LIGPNRKGYSPFLPNSIDNTYGDHAALKLFAAINNLLDKGAPVSYNRTSFEPFDPIGRTYRVGVRYGF
jgi:outer membrane receptor protein involved in Fe transport